MISLVPEWALEQPEFWDAIRRRNLWFIKLRYIVVVMLCVFLFLSFFLFKLKFTETQLTAGFAITASILIYNVILHRLRKYIKLEAHRFNPLYLSLLQMVLDLSSLLLLVYFTGGHRHLP